MDDLQTLATALHKPDPSPETVDEGRHRLQNAMRRRPPRRRTTGWLAAGLSLAGAAAATVAVISSGPAEPSTPPNGPPAPMSAKQVLLVAATTAERTPEGKGTYWHVRTVQQNPNTAPRIRERWTARTGETWFRGGVKTGGKLVKSSARTVLRLGGVPVTFQDIQKLPADPDALKARIAEAAQRSDLQTSAGKLTKADRERLVFLDLVSLVTTVPAKPQVRAAAFRAIASYPGVESIGKVDSGRKLQFPVSGGHQAKLVVDPETGQVRNTNFYAAPSGPTVWSPHTMTIDASWTDTLPG